METDNQYILKKIIDYIAYKKLIVVLTDEAPPHSVKQKNLCIVCLNVNSPSLMEDLAHELLHCLGLNEKQVEAVLTEIKHFMR